jgi:hypothetical protein
VTASTSFTRNSSSATPNSAQWSTQSPARGRQALYLRINRDSILNTVDRLDFDRQHITSLGPGIVRKLDHAVPFELVLGDHGTFCELERLGDDDAVIETR